MDHTRWFSMTQSTGRENAARQPDWNAGCAERCLSGVGESWNETYCCKATRRFLRLPFQDIQQRNPASQPRWDRFERADLFAQYRELRTQGMSERQAAKELKVPRTTLQAWRLWHDTLDSCPHVAAFFQSGPGLAFLHRIVIAFHLVCVEVGACGMRLVCLFLPLTGLNRLVAAS